MGKNTTISFQNNLELGSNILFEGKINFGKNNRIDSNCFLKDTKCGDNNHIKMSSSINNCRISNKIIIGPFAFIREKTRIEKNCIIGAYVEVVRSAIEQNTFISHRAFIGDAKIGKRVIIGAGAIFCNYSFKTNSKQKTTVGDYVKVGSNTTIIAPIKIKNKEIIPALTRLKKN
jgi:bifunctional UDP-N-acetylglucosamine pyrophosphorylase/glucosamine-1-phosphate N-acetyltransferase